MCCKLKKLGVLKCTVFLTLFLFLATFYPLYLLPDLSRLPIRCSTKILTTSTPNVLEEMLWAYTTLWSIRRMNLSNRTVCVPKAVFDELKKYFESLSLCTVNDLPLICNYETYHATVVSPIQYPNSLLDAVHVSINFTGKSLENPKPIVYSAKSMSSEFVILKNFTAFAERALQKSIKYLNLEGSEIPLTTVCIWIKQPNWFPVSKYFKRARESYFRYSMSIFRKHHHPLFMAIGDLRSAEELLEGDDFVIVRTRSVGQLLAIMALCNHTIIEPAPLSLWAAFRNRGFKVVYGVPSSWENILWAEKDWMLLNLHPNGSFPPHVKEDIKMLGPIDFFKFM